MVLNDNDIFNLIQGSHLVESPHNRQDYKINPASLDLTSSIHRVIAPGESLLISTQEVIRMPDYLSGLITLRTSMFRKGLALASPGWIDPGFSGNLTVRLTNVTTVPVALNHRERFIQIIFHPLTAPPGSSYDGKYQGSVGTVGYKPD